MSWQARNYFVSRNRNEERPEPRSSIANSQLRIVDIKKWSRGCLTGEAAMQATTRCIDVQTGADSKVGESPFRRCAAAVSLQVFASTEIREIEDLSQVAV